MIRLALPKGRNLEPALSGLASAGVEVGGFDPQRLRQRLEPSGIEVLLLKDWDLPLYVEHGIADCGVVGSDVLEELRSDLLVPLRWRDGRSRLSMIGLDREPPPAGEQIRVATKYPGWAGRLLADRPWSVEILRLQGSVELGPLLDLAEVAVDIVQTGATLRAHGLCEIEVLAEVAPCLVANRGSYQHRRRELNDLMRGLERAGVVA